MVTDKEVQSAVRQLNSTRSRAASNGLGKKGDLHDAIARRPTSLELGCRCMQQGGKPQHLCGKHKAVRRRKATKLLIEKRVR